MTEVFVALWPLGPILVLLLLLSGMFSASETSLFNLGAVELRQLSERHPRIGRLLRRLKSADSGVLVTILLGNLIVNILYFNLGRLLTHRLSNVGATSLAVAMPLLLLVVLILAGEVVPKLVSVSWSAHVARIVSMPLAGVHALLFVPRYVLSRLSDFFVRLVVGSRVPEGELSALELERLVDAAAKEGTIAEDENDWLRSVLLLGGMTVHEVMVPRLQLVCLERGGSRQEFLDFVMQHRKNKIPVYRGTLDHVDGFLDVKEVLGDPTAELDSLVRPVVFVPETTQVEMVVERFLREGVRLMIVVDEYGGTAGLLTHEDLVEAVIGDLDDESDPVEPSVVKVGPYEFHVHAGLSIKLFGRLIGRRTEDLPVSSVGGLVTWLLDRMPRLGDRTEFGRVRMEVTAMRGRRPERVRVRLEPKLRPGL